MKNHRGPGLINRGASIALSLLLLIPASIAAAAQELASVPALLAPQSQQAAALPESAQEKVVTVYGAKIHYREAGSGPVVILLHGLGADNSSWAMSVDALAKHFRVIAPDQIGFGKSDKPMINYRIRTLVDFLDGFYKELKIERASLVGNSLGGFAASSFALAHPEKVERLVLVDAAGYSLPKGTDPKLLSVLNPSTLEQTRQILSLIFYNKQLYLNDATVSLFFTRKITAGDSYTVERFIESIARGEDVLDESASSIKQPTLIVWGREDQLTPLGLAERFKKDIAGSELLIIEKCGHVPQIEQAAQFNSAVIKFLGGSQSASK